MQLREPTFSYFLKRYDDDESMNLGNEDVEILIKYKKFTYN